MADKRPGPIKRSASAVLRYLDIVRRVVTNLVFVGVLVVLVVLLRGDRPEVPDGAARVVQPRGDLVEQYSGNQALNRLLGAEVQETRLRDLRVALERAAEDDRIEVVVLGLSRLGAAPMSKLQTLGEAIDALREADKKVYAYADSYDQGRYYLAAHADEAYVHPMGMALIQGFGVYQKYFRDLLDTLKLDVHVFRVGKFKSAVEPWIRNDMSEDAERAARGWLSDLWASYKTGVANARDMSPQTIGAYADGYPERVDAAEGDAAAAALDDGLIDGILDREAFRKRLIALVGEDPESKRPTFLQVGQREYLRARGESGLPSGDEAGIGVIVASGTIVEGEGATNQVGAEPMVGMIRRARENDSIEALVLRVDSPGGSAFASERIRHELELTREAGKPVVVSMSSLAASGGYWISLASDEIWARPATLTGSIGVFGLIPTYQDTLAEAGVYTDGVGTTSMAGALRLDRELDPEVSRAIQRMVEHTYGQFLDRVASSRDLDRERVAQLAQGRVWSGRAAKERGLVDALGGLPAALDSAAELADLDPDTAEHRYLHPPRPYGERIARLLQGSIERGALSWLPQAVRRDVRETAGSLGLLGSDPRGIYAYCPCGVR